MRGFSAFAATVTLLLVSFASQATIIKGSYDVTLNDADPGLVVQYSDIANPFSMDLAAGESTTFALFDIWTDESWVNKDDENPMPISVDFEFTLPEVISGSLGGSTAGVRGFLSFSQWGELTWDGTETFTFGPNNDGSFDISLSDVEFNEGDWWGGLKGGSSYGATVEATFTLLSDATTVVPEPGTLGMLGIGLLMLGLFSRRKHSS
ncbi:MAG TPA: PEP-CTERM sorting domain-containing protein [Salinisphaeraceae bacterium]|nr:PEP-CTERM sorting domain-containing protein [Salinisphaeraceae bacterium]